LSLSSLLYVQGRRSKEVGGSLTERRVASRGKGTPELENSDAEQSQCLDV